jgi:hypothetical protein
MTSTIRDLTELLTVASNDYLLISDTSDVTNRDKRISQVNLIGGVLSGGGTLATGGFTLTVPATGTAALKTGTPTASNLASWNNANTVQDGGFAVSDIARLSAAQTFAGILTLNQNITMPPHRGVVPTAETIPNNTALQISDLPLGGGVILLSSNFNGACGIFQFRANSGAFCNIVCQIGTVLAASTAVLLGTTGTAGKITFSSNALNNCYVENQTGQSITVRITVLSGN